MRIEGVLGRICIEGRLDEKGREPRGRRWESGGYVE